MRVEIKPFGPFNMQVKQETRLWPLNMEKNSKLYITGAALASGLTVIANGIVINPREYRGYIQIKVGEDLCLAYAADFKRV